MQAPTTAEAPGYTDSCNDAVLLATGNVTYMQCGQAILQVHPYAYSQSERIGERNTVTIARAAVMTVSQR